MAGSSDKHGKASKAQRNYRTNGQDRGPSPSIAASTKYVRSGGPLRSAKRKARNHGCDNPNMHRKPLGDIEREHSHKPLTST